MLLPMSSSSNKDTDDNDPLLSEDPASNIATLLEVRIKSTMGDETLEVSSHSNIATIKQQVLTALGPSAQDRYIRLICKGRLLAPDSALLKEFGVADGDVVHAVLAASGVRGGQQAALSRGASTRRYRGAGVGPLGRVVRQSRGTADEESDDSGDEQIEEGRERIGFDRLRTSGMSRSEVTAIRSYFSRQVDRYVQQNPNIASDEQDLLRRRLLQEDAWMQAQGPTSEFRLNLNQTNPLLPSSTVWMRTSVGTDRDFLWGFLLGFFVGFLMLVWVWMPTVPHKQKLGILTGISLQLTMSLLRSSGADEAALAFDAGN